jgi:hypothetical protein
LGYQRFKNFQVFFVFSVFVFQNVGDRTRTSAAVISSRLARRTNSGTIVEISSNCLASRTILIFGLGSVPAPVRSTQQFKRANKQKVLEPVLFCLAGGTSLVGQQTRSATRNGLDGSVGTRPRTIRRRSGLRRRLAIGERTRRRSDGARTIRRRSGLRRRLAIGLRTRSRSFCGHLFRDAVAVVRTVGASGKTRGALQATQSTRTSKHQTNKQTKQTEEKQRVSAYRVGGGIAQPSSGGRIHCRSLGRALNVRHPHARAKRRRSSLSTHGVHRAVATETH